MNPPEDLLDALRARYSEPQRHYHTWEHITALLGHFHGVAETLNDAEATIWALYWHDAVYDPQKSDNEEASADLLLVDANDYLDPNSIARADRIIRATKQHLVPKNLSAFDQHDLQIFLDIDLSILATSGETFDVYEDNIRKEYAFVPEPVYGQARASILSGFLERDRLYFSEHLYNQWEHKARANLKRSIARLTP